jgi:RND family efflux transporter MFP subunit
MLRALLLLVALVAPAAAQPPPPTVTVAAPLAQPIREWDEFTGRFEAAARVEVRPRVSGFIEGVSFRDGQLVREGEVLFSIDRRPYQIARDAADAEAARAQAQLDLANNDVERALQLVQSRSIPQRELDSRQAQARVALASLLAARASQATARLNFEWTDVRAPIAGRISNRRVDVGNLVSGANEGGTLLTTIVALDPIYLEFDASEADFIKYSRLAQSGGRGTGREVRHPVQARLADQQGWPIEGVLDFVDNVLNPRTGTIRARGIVANPDAFLTPGMFARLRLFAGEAPALLVPDAAIVADQARRIVLAVNAENVVEPRIVTLGPLIDGLRVIRSGIEPTDRIIINGLANPFVRPGARVMPQPGTISAQQAAAQAPRQ